MGISYESCTLCPRRCGVNRAAGELGFCRMGGHVRVARAAPHYWEEPVLSDGGGSGTVFFSGCTLRCSFCQNSRISRDGFGEELDKGRLRGILEQLVDAGVENINLVTPTHFLPDILPALEPKLPVPVVYNCGGYESVETLRALEGYVDIYLPDYKYADAALAARLSGAGDYPETALLAIREMIRQTGAPVMSEDGHLLHGTLIRHLILPGYLDNTLGAIEAIAALPKGQYLFSLMRQYTPINALPAPLDRMVTDEEADAALSWAMLCGLDEGFYQDAQSAEDAYIPDFSLQCIDRPWEPWL